MSNEGLTSGIYYSHEDDKLFMKRWSWEADKNS